MRFSPSAEERRRIEKPFGVRFSAADYQQLIGIVDGYFGMEPFETAAPFADDAHAWLDDVRTKANAFWRTLEPPASQREAAFFVQRLIIENFHEGQQSGPHKWDEIIMFMAAFVAASGLAAPALSKRMKGGGIVEGHAWRKLIRELTGFCEERSLPTGASKGLIKRDEPSPFIAFVYELQRAFPENFRRHNFSYDALATAIASARRAPAREIKSGKAQI